MDAQRKAIIREAYNVAAEKYAECCFFELYDKPLDKKLYDLFFERVVNKGPALEIGCGPGEVSNYLKMKGLEIIGIDYSEKMIEMAQRLNPYIDFRVGDVFHLDFEAQSIAGVVAPYLIVNFTISDVAHAVEEIGRVLMKSGQLLLSFHSGKQELLVKDFFMPGNQIPYTFFEPNEVRDLLAQHGFKIIELINRMPYEGEETTRTYIFAEKI